VARSALEAIQRLQKAAKEKGREKSTPPPLVGLDGFQRVAEMTLADFSRAGLVVRVTSALLGEDVLFVSDNVRPASVEGNLVVYTAAELGLFVSMPAECVRTLHAVKKKFPGSLLWDLFPDEKKEDG